jgi:hypothetical protein
MKYKGCKMTMTMVSVTQRSGVENIHRIHRSTGRARHDAYTLNFVIKPNNLNKT